MIDRLLVILLAGGCIVLAAILAAELSAARAPASGPLLERVPPPRSAPLPNTVRTPPPAQFNAMVAEILARPLFSATRRPPSAKVGPDQDTSLADIRLAGIVTEPGTRFAIFASTSAKPLVVKEGDLVGGWRVETITPLQVSLTGPTGTKTLVPKNDPNLVPPPPPPTMPGAPIPVPVARPPAVASQGRPIPPIFPPRPPLRPGQLRERR